MSVLFPVFFLSFSLGRAAEIQLVDQYQVRAAIVLDSEAGPLSRKAAELLDSRVEQRTGAHLTIVSGAEAANRLSPETSRIILATPGSRLLAALAAPLGTVPSAAELGEEGFFIATSGRDIVLLAREGRGMIYAVGKLLHTAQCGKGSLRVVARGEIEKPEQRTRVLYLATHFDNFYEVRPLAAIYPIIEEAALWGINGVSVWLDQSQYNDPFDPKVVDTTNGKILWKKDKEILEAAQQLGLMPGLVICANTIYKNQASPAILSPPPPPPPPFRSQPDRPLADPTISEGLRVILGNDTNLFQDVAADGIKLNNVLIFPYDTGGCFSERCKPWALTFLKLSQQEAAVIHRYHSAASIYVTDWLFDKDEVKITLDFFNQQKPEWLAGIWEDPSTQPYTTYRLLGPNYAKLSFQDITMIGGWGTMGANPFPALYKKAFENMQANKFAGYMDYTEGIFDDLNDALTAQLAWDPSASTDSIGRDYCNYFFGPGLAEAFLEIVRLMQDSWRPSATSSANYDWRFVAGVPEAAKLESLTESVAAKLPAETHQSWRWQVIERRARIELLVAKLHDEPAFRAETARQLKDGTGKPVLWQRLSEKQAEVDAYKKEVRDLASMIYGEPPTRIVSMDPSGQYMTDATGVSLRAWEQTLEELRKRLMH
jgi:hypothetical protein